MARSRESIVNLVTGERITWLKTAADTAGETLEVDLSLRAGAAVSAEHRHVHQVELFRVLTGSLSVTVGVARAISRLAMSSPSLLGWPIAGGTSR